MSRREKIKIEEQLKKNNKKKLRWGRIAILLLIIVGAILTYKYDLIPKAILLVNPILIQNIEINTEKTQIELGESIDITSKIYPENFSKGELTWYSSNTEILEIIDGKVTGKSVGKATVYLTDGETKSNELEIECLVSISEVTVNNLVSEIKLGEIYTLETTVLPENATYKELTYESSNADIITVNDNGSLIANAIGNANISIKNYKDEILTTLEIEVKKIPVESITLDDKEVTLGKGQTYIINSKVTPLEATYTDVEWETSDKNVVKIENRQITAVGTGTATITAVTDEGDKTATCTIKVTNEAPNNSKKFANGKYNIRTGASTDYKILATTSKYEEIELLQDSKNGWKKVRNSSGVVGYTLIKSNYYLDEKPVENVTTDSGVNPEDIVTSYHISGVPYLNQISLGYPTGCEAVSAAMVLKFKGYKVSSQNIIDNTKTGSKKYQGSDGAWYGANPFEEFVGHPAKGLSKGSYGVFAKPIANAMSVYAGEKVKNISGCSENDLFAYVSKGNPVVIWCVKNAGDLKEGVTWKYEDGSGTFKELVGEHCAVLIGYDEDYVYLNDPSAGENVKQSKSKFISNWKKLYSQAIVVQ